MQNDTNAPVDTQAENAPQPEGSSAGAGGYTATRGGKDERLAYLWERYRRGGTVPAE